MVNGKKVTRQVAKKVTGKKVTIYFLHIYYTPESQSMHNEWLCPYPGYGVYRHFQNFYGDMVAFCFIITIYLKFGFILINNNIWSAHTVHTYYLITRTNINLIFELCKLITGKQIGTPSASQSANIYFPHNFSNFSIFVDFPTYLDCWEKNNLFTDGNREKIISSQLFIFVTLSMYG